MWKNLSSSQRAISAVVGLGLMAALVVAVLLLRRASSAPEPVGDPLIPTPVQDAAKKPEVTLTPLILHKTYAVEPMPTPEPGTLRWRVGVGISARNPDAFAWPDLRPGWFVNWHAGLFDTAAVLEAEAAGASTGAVLVYPIVADMAPAAPSGMEYAPMARVFAGDPALAEATLAEMAAHNPGHTWLIGNEPDVPWQDNATPEQYARGFHRAAAAIRRGDPTARIAAGGLSQITPLRLRYLDRVWQAYRDQFGVEMPVDVWTMHAFVLREERGAWGVDIPPGFDDVDRGELWEIDDHDDLALVEEQVRAMRRWMAEHDQRDKPLWITEYGILMPVDYGFTPERVITFLRGSFDRFQTLSDPEIGYAADGDRLVQRWAWFSTRYPPYPVGNLFNSAGRPTAVMRALVQYLEENGP